MYSLKTFFITFLSALCITFVGFASLYWVITPSSHPTDIKQSGIPITTAQKDDNKTTLLSLQLQDTQFFFTIKLNAMDKEISVTAIPSDFYLPSAQRTLSQSFEYAGIMQCVQDLSSYLDTTIDYHLYLDSDYLIKLAKTLDNNLDLSHLINNDSLLQQTNQFLSPQTFAGYIATTPHIFNNSSGLASLCSIITEIIKSDSLSLQNQTITEIQNNISYLATNIGKTEAIRIIRILSLLQHTSPQYNINILSSD